MSLSVASCFHEAGHAVALVALGLRDLLGEVVVREDGSGFVQFDRESVAGLESSPPEDEEEWERAGKDRALFKIAVVLAGGREAQRLFDPGAAESILEYGADTDIDKIALLTRSMSRGGRRGMPYRAQVTARDILRRHWTIVARLALEIHSRGTLTGAEAREIVEAHMEQEEEQGETVGGGSAE